MQTSRCFSQSSSLHTYRSCCLVAYVVWHRSLQLVLVNQAFGHGIPRFRGKLTEFICSQVQQQQQVIQLLCCLIVTAEDVYMPKSTYVCFAGDSGKPPNLLVVSVNKLQCKGYFPAVSPQTEHFLLLLCCCKTSLCKPSSTCSQLSLQGVSIPSTLELCVAQELLAGSQRMIRCLNRLQTTPEMIQYARKLSIVSCCRRRPYAADSHVLEFAFYKHFEDMHSAQGMTFGLNQQSGLGVDSYKAKLQFIHAMSDRKLVSWCLCCMNTFPSL